MKFSASIPALAMAQVTSIVVVACGESDPVGPTATATVSGAVKAASGAAVDGASVRFGSVIAATGPDGRLELEHVPVGRATIITSAPRFDPLSESVSPMAGTNVHDVDGNRLSGSISTYACYRSTRSSARWVPSYETALSWQSMAGGTVDVSAC
jgi:hypothetical protein